MSTLGPCTDLTGRLRGPKTSSYRDFLLQNNVFYESVYGLSCPRLCSTKMSHTKSKNEIKVQWTNSQKSKFIDLWRHRPDLYSNKSPEYKNRTKRTCLLNEIAIEMCELRPFTSISEVKDLMNSMTTNFNASYKRYKKSCKSGTGLVDIPKALRDLDFLQPTGSNILSNYEVFNDVEVTQNTTKIGENLNEEHSHVTTSLNTRKRKKIDSVEAFALCSALKDLTSNKSEYTIFGEYVASELAKLKNKRSIINVKNKINNILAEALLEELDD